MKLILEGALEGGGISLAYKFDHTPIIWLDYFHPNRPQELVQFYDEVGPDTASGYRYLLVGIPAFHDTIIDVLEDPNLLGTSLGAVAPGYTSPIPVSVIARRSIKADWFQPPDASYPNGKKWPEMMAAVVVHELGHSRATLRHPHEFPDDHSISSSACVMHSLKTLPWQAGSVSPDRTKVLKRCTFCGPVPGINDSTTCRHFLVRSSQ